MTDLHDEGIRAAADALHAHLMGLLERAGPGHAIGYRVKPEPFWRESILHGTVHLEYETHLVALEPDGTLRDGLAGFRYVARGQL